MSLIPHSLESESQIPCTPSFVERRFGNGNYLSIAKRLQHFKSTYFECPIFKDQKGNNKHFFENAVLKFLRDCITNWKIDNTNSRVECLFYEQMIFNKWTDESISDWISGF